MRRRLVTVELAVSLLVPTAAAVGCRASPPALTAGAAAPSRQAAIAGAPTTRAEAASAPPAEAGFVRRDVNHVLVTGQSLAIGVSGAPPLSLAQPYGNLMFNTGVMAGGEGLESWEPLVEGDFIPGSKAVVETMASGFANLVSELSLVDEAPGGRHDLLMSIHGSGARPYSGLKRGSRSWTNGLAQVTAGLEIARKLGKSYVVRALLNVHGESDHAEKSTRYEADLLEWQAEYEKDVRAITGQAEPVPMFVTQISSWTKMMGGTETSAIPGAQLAAHVVSAGRVVLVGPKYHLPYVKDGVHLTPQGYRHMGEDYAKAYRRVVLEGKPWEPLRPIAVTRDGAAITVKLAVPSPPIVLDTTLVTDPGSYGFEYTDSSSASPQIAKVEVTGPDTVVVTLSAVPTGQDRHLRYAFTGIRGAPSGPSSGARGNLRDSDKARSRARGPLYNWCIHFDEPVP